MNEAHHYRTVATSPDGRRAVLVRGLPKQRAERIAEQLRDEGWEHSFVFAAECENCIDPETGAPMPEDAS